MALVKRLLELEQDSQREQIRKIVEELNSKIYFVAHPENPHYLYHTTSFKILQLILKEGCLRSDPQLKTKIKKTIKHPGMICFTTNPLRHLSDLPGWLLPPYVTHDVYLKFPFHAIPNVKPVFYTFDHKLPIDAHLHLESEERLRKRYADDFDLWKYNTWYVENEWRIKAYKLKLPKSTTIGVSTRYQLRKISSITNFPVFIDQEIRRIKEALHIPRVIRQLRRLGGWLQRKIEALDKAYRQACRQGQWHLVKSLSAKMTVLQKDMITCYNLKRGETEKAKQLLQTFKRSYPEFFTGEPVVG